MEMQQVRYFVTLAQVLNFTRAADLCNVSQPALTRAIQQLEHELGGPLFHRERGNTHLSELGRMMQPYLAMIHEQTAAAKEHARSASRLQEGTLTIGAMCTIGPQLVADLIIRFRTAHPDVQLIVVDGSAPQMIERLEKGELEIAIVGVPEELPESLHQLPIFKEPFVIVLPPNHRLCASNPIRAAELHEEPYVSRSNCEVFTAVRRDLIEPRHPDAQGVQLDPRRLGAGDDQGRARPRLLPGVRGDRCRPGGTTARRPGLRPHDLRRHGARAAAFADGRRVRPGSAAISLAGERQGGQLARFEHC